jgi:hypothetical protein
MEEKERNHIIEDLKGELEDLEDRLKKSGADMKQAYEEKKKKMAEILRIYANDMEKSGQERFGELKGKASELIDLLEADYNVSYSEYEEEPHKISKALEDFEKKAKEVIEEIESGSMRLKEGVEKDLKQSLEKFRTELDIQKAHFKATRDRASGEYEVWKTKRLKDIEELKARLSTQKEDAEDRMEGFRDEMFASLKHLRGAFRKLW